MQKLTQKISTLFILIVFSGCGNPVHKKSNLDNLSDSKATDSIIENNMEKTQSELPEKDTLEILLGCGIAGVSSEQFSSAKDLISAKDYKAIAKGLSSPDKLSRIISVIALEELNKRKVTTISLRENELIFQIKKSTQKLYVCSGCSGHYYGLVHAIFENKCPVDVVQAIKYKIGFTDK